MNWAGTSLISGIVISGRRYLPPQTNYDTFDRPYRSDRRYLPRYGR